MTESADTDADPDTRPDTTPDTAPDRAPESTSGTGRPPTDVWAGVLERIVQGFTHDLNNRLLVLVGVRDLLEPPGGADAGLLELMDRELDGLDRETRLLRRLVIEDPEVETVDPRDILSTARALHRRHRGLHTVDLEWAVPDGLPAVHTRPSAAVRALLLLLAASGEAALEAGARDANVDVSVEDGAVVVALTPPPGEARRHYTDATAAMLGTESGVVAATSAACTLSLEAVEG